MTLLNINRQQKPKALLILPEGTHDVRKIFVNYLMKLGELGKNVQVMTVKLPSKGRLAAAVYNPIKEEIDEYCELNDITTLIVTNAELIRQLLHRSKKFELERSIGKAFEYENYTIIPTINYFVLSFAPVKAKLIQKSLQVVQDVLNGTYTDNTDSFIDNLSIAHPKDISTAKIVLKELLTEDILTCDIETTGLSWHSDRLLSISFSKSDAEAVVIDFKNLGNKGFSLLKNWIKTYKGRLVFHNVVFDIPFLVFNLFMKDLDDHKGMIGGVNQFKLDDTIVMAYLCLNSTERPTLGLKDLVYHKFGDYDAHIDQSNLDFTDIDEVAKYNAMDTMATYYLWDKYLKLLKEEEQYNLYMDYYRKVIPALIKLKMSGLTLDRKKVEKAYEQLDTLIVGDTEKLQSFKAVVEVKQELNRLTKEKYNKTHVRQKTEEDFDIPFNPASTTHKRILLFDVLGLQHKKLTKKGLQSTDKEVLGDLLASATDYEKEILQLLVDIADAGIVRNTFLNAFLERGIYTPKGDYKLYGDYKLFGTASGRLSSYNINLQNLPSTASKYAKLVKECIVPLKGFLIAGSDYSSAEDRYIASIAKCKNKIKIYKHNIDAHSFNAAGYFKDELEDRGIFIDMEDVQSVNSVKTVAKDLRQISKSVTFSSSYGGGIVPIMNALKCSKAKAEGILDAYKALYPELEDFANETMAFARTNGFVTGFKGLKLRCPNIKAEDIEATSSMKRTLNNMRVQSCAMLTLQAITLFQDKIEECGLEESIRVYATIHDSIYLYFKPTEDVLQFINKFLIEFMCKEYENQIVPNEASIDIGTSWANLEEIPNHIDSLDYTQVIKKYVV